MALKDQWQILKKQRRQAIIERRQQVQTLLNSHQEKRQTTAQTLQENLAQFRVNLTQDNETRMVEAQINAALRQEYCENMSRQTQELLSNAAQNRQETAAKLAQELDEFVQTLQQKTTTFLELTAVERSLMATQLIQELQLFHHQLDNAGLLLHQQLQTQVNSLKLDTYNLLSIAQQQRILTQAQLSQELATFIETLRTDVQNYLQDLALLRENRSQQIQEILKQNRTNRQVNTQLLFEKFAKFRTQLQDYRTQISLEVRGNTGTETPAPPPPPKPAPVPVIKPAIPALSVPVENKVYDYINQSQGAKLTTIETALKLNRIQTIDALSSLIKKGLISQNGRTYRVQNGKSLELSNR